MSIRSRHSSKLMSDKCCRSMWILVHQNNLLISVGIDSFREVIVSLSIDCRGMLSIVFEISLCYQTIVDNY